MIPGQARTVACVGFSYITKIIAAGVFILALGEAVNFADLWLQSRSDK